uniref:Mitochondrial ribosomal protein L1 n=1 Tax=Salmo trutta TaxID=8032 RepID=A0A673XAD6_SALTR
MVGGPTYGSVSQTAPRHLPVRIYAALMSQAAQQYIYMHVLNLLFQKKVDLFVSTVYLPYLFKTDVNKVSVFTENPDQAKVAQENGAAFVGGADLVQRILDDEVDVDFYIFPKNKRGSVGVDIPKMLELFQTGHENAVITRVGMVSLRKSAHSQQTVVEDVCYHQPTRHFIERAIVGCQISEALLFKSEELVQKVTVKKDGLRCL